MEAIGGLLGVIAITLLVVLAILWICLPFAVFGVKDKIDALTNEAKVMNETLHDIKAALEKRP